MTTHSSATAESGDGQQAGTHSWSAKALSSRPPSETLAAGQSGENGQATTQLRLYVKA